MAASFPSAVKSFSARTDDVHNVMAADVNSAYDEISAIETELGTDPAGTATDVKTRLAQSLGGTGNLDFATSTELTISSGAITPTQNWHTVDTQSDAATDDLGTINTSNATDGFVLFLRQANDARDVTIKHDTGNIKCPSGVDIVLADTTQLVIFIYDATLAKWLASVSPSNAGLTNAANVWSGKQTYQAGVRKNYTSLSTNTTLGTTHHFVNVDATSGSIQITLPTAASISGTEYIIRKSDSGSLVVNVDAYSSETISGSSGSQLSFDIASQYKTYQLMSDGTNWMVLSEY
jgi:DUF4097 and DUF4098 domain-containing protein YvlB